MIEGLLQFLQIDDLAKERGRELWTLLAPHIDDVVGDFYRDVQMSAVSPHIDDAAVARLKVSQKEHWRALFNSRFDDDFVNRVRRIGIRHRDIDLNPMWYVAGYMKIKIAFMNLIAESGRPALAKGRLMKTLDKYTALDMALAMSTYHAAIFD